MTEILLSDRVETLYEPGVRAARTRFATESAISTVLAADIEPALLELFLIYYNALGVSMTEPVEGWLRRAGERCEQIGLTELGNSMRAHVKHEAGHHRMMIKDARTLVAHWNERRSPALDADQLLAQPMTPNVHIYRKLHEEVIASDDPYGQLAIQYEIELLALRYGAQLLDQCNRLLGAKLVKALTFVPEHVELDVAHTQDDKHQINQLLAQNPEYITPLINAGVAALDAYAEFLNDCLRLAKAQLSAGRTST